MSAASTTRRAFAQCWKQLYALYAHAVVGNRVTYIGNARKATRIRLQTSAFLATIQYSYLKFTRSPETKQSSFFFSGPAVKQKKPQPKHDCKMYPTLFNLICSKTVGLVLKRFDEPFQPRLVGFGLRTEGPKALVIPSNGKDDMFSSPPPPRPLPTKYICFLKSNHRAPTAWVTAQSNRRNIYNVLSDQRNIYNVLSSLAACNTRNLACVL